MTLPVDPQRIYLVPTGVAPARAGRGHLRAGGSSRSDRVVLFVGRVNREKGIDLLLPAFDRVLQAQPRARLVLVGAVYEPRWLRRMIRNDRVIVTGQQPPEAVAAAYERADVFAFPSGTDTQALVLQEAALAGVPSVLVDPVLHRRGALAGAAVLASEGDLRRRASSSCSPTPPRPPPSASWPGPTRLAIRRRRSRRPCWTSTVSSWLVDVLVVQHPLAQTRLTALRDSRTDSASFRAALHELATMLTYEAARTFEAAAPESRPRSRSRGGRAWPTRR